ncbi:hypothetical protein SPRG_05907 [Saprolegnia parasitica CBS 223.65]|uniref:BAG domain-containing protein n=1 Tax=Saprolegnia parasitica (strain CBS 223.65) TaxID=695850 RepID=A0A067CS68_SAPPC|nr:hypothetical protein SPRG_05907 [Saprolegnia parasitica CBS 223.65]KDO29371.1 hypothetical protein SPRG_05907 [Saprolegnia parasitica CBS 223.65]|eukprot:XP_012199874.1 hypothetical protein SPRG_05907 [Saprolegnia parasitica CBS 223.65]
MTSTSTSSVTSQLVAIAGHIDRATDMVTSRLVHQHHITAATLAASKWITAVRMNQDHAERTKQCKQRLGQYRARVLAQSERLTQLLMELDTIESNGDATIRAERKRLLKVADELAAKSERLLERLLALAKTVLPEMSVPAQSDQEVREMQRLLDALPMWTPNAQFVDAGNSVVLRVNLAGVNRASTTVSVTPDGHLQIAGYKFPTPHDLVFMHTHRQPRFGRFVVAHAWPRHAFDVANLRFRQLPTGVLEVVAPRHPIPGAYNVHDAAAIARPVAGVA